MRILALLSVLVALVSVSVVTASALAQDDVTRAPTLQFAEDVPQLLPMTKQQPATATSVSRSGIDELAVIAAAYWLLLGGVAARRARRAYSVNTAA